MMGKLTCDLGNAYQKPGVSIHNGSLLFWLYHRSVDEYPHANLAQNLVDTVAYIDDAIAPLETARMDTVKAPIIQRELALAAMMMKHGAQRGLLMLSDSSVHAQLLLTEFNRIHEEFQHVWLARNRPGGLPDSLARLDKSRALYLNGST